MSRSFALASIPCLALLLLAAPTASAHQAPSTSELAAAWDAGHLPMPLPPLLTHRDVVDALARATASAPDLFHVEPIGESVEGRSINHLWFGHGPFKVLLWSQMHGDEPTATVALFDVLDYVARNRQAPDVTRLLDRLEIHIVPMLNPDGAERFTRRNAQGIDINRDALLLQTPEGRALKALRDRLEPQLGFNLHNQNWRTAVGDTGKAAAVSLLAVAFDEARSDNPGRVRAKKVCSVIRDALEPLAPGMIGRYDDAFEVRAFGDNITKWGTPVVLIETGPYPGADPDRALVRLNFVGILSALNAVASGSVDAADPSRYERLPFNDGRLFYTLIEHGTILPGTGVAPFLGDVGIAASRVVRVADGARQARFAGHIDDLGDLRVYGALERIDAAGLIVAPLWREDLAAGDTVDAPPLRTGGATIAPGQPGAVAILAPADGGRYVVRRIVRVD
jgi:hypothetical protein